MSKESRLIKNTAIIAVGNMFTKCISFFMLPLYTSLMSSQEYGIVDMVSTYSAVLVILLTLQLEQGVFRYLIESRNNHIEQKKYISTTIFSLIILNLSIVIVLNMILLKIKYEYTVYMNLNILMGVCISIFLQIPRGLGNNVVYATASCISGSMNVVLNVIFIAIFHWNVKGMLLASILCQGIASIYIFIRIKLWEYISIKYVNKKSLKSLLKFSLPLVPNTFCWWVISASDRVIINTCIGIVANGIYSVAYKFPSLFSMVSNIFQTSWTESVSESIKDDNNDFYINSVMDKSIKFYSSANIMIIACIPFIFSFLINQNFVEAYLYIPILMTAAFFHSVANLYGSIYTAYKMTNEIAKTTVLAGVLNIGINLLLIKKMGLYAAAYSSLISYLVITIVRHKDIQKKVKIVVRKKYIFIEGTVYFGILYAYYSKNFVTQLISLILLVPYCIWQNESILKGMYRMTISKNKKRQLLYKKF